MLDSFEHPRPGHSTRPARFFWSGFFYWVGFLYEAALDAGGLLDARRPAWFCCLARSPPAPPIPRISRLAHVLRPHVLAWGHPAAKILGTAQWLVYDRSVRSRRLSIITLPMSIHFPCEGCSRPLSAPDDKAGKLAICPECGARLRVPGGNAPA
ncbi:MAG: hypothetical protein ACK5HA_11165, partial [Planctomycetaceae bacterium]